MSVAVLQALLFLLPAIVVVLPLLARRYPGEKALVALRRTSPLRPTRAERAPLDHGRTEVSTPRGGLLIGRSLAVRPPPLAPAAS
jgi:hypothetical protein